MNAKQAKKITKHANRGFDYGIYNDQMKKAAKLGDNRFEIISTLSKSYGEYTLECLMQDLIDDGFSIDTPEIIGETVDSLDFTLWVHWG